jgi:hypothetical protein
MNRTDREKLKEIMERENETTKILAAIKKEKTKILRPSTHQGLSIGNVIKVKKGTLNDGKKCIKVETLDEDAWWDHEYTYLPLNKVHFIITEIRLENKNPFVCECITRENFGKNTEFTFGYKDIIKQH